MIIRHFFDIANISSFWQNRRQISSGLVPQAHIKDEGRAWHRAVFDDLKFRICDDLDFPCVFARNAFKKQLLRFIFVENITDSGIKHLANGLSQYVELSREWSGDLDTAYPLIVAFSLDAIKAHSVDRYHTFGWNVLQKLHAVDLAPWPPEIAKDPSSSSWSMCFNGMPLFCNMSHPKHIVRRSRNLGGHFMLVINPRERFDQVAGDTPSGRKVRSTIRKRIAKFDGAAHSVQLASYGADGIEWWQYGIIEENIERTDQCPFKYREY